MWRQKRLVCAKKGLFILPFNKRLQTLAAYPMFGPMPGAVNGGAMMFGAGAGMVAPQVATATSGSSQGPVKSVEQIRAVFPETWLWSNSSVG